MTQKSSIAQDPTSTDPEYLREGDEIAWTIPVSGVVTGVSSPTMTFYKEGGSTDLSTTYFSGSMSISGVNTIITKTTQSLKAGNYVMSIKATVDGVVQIVCTTRVIVKRRSEV